MKINVDGKYFTIRGNFEYRDIFVKGQRVKGYSCQAEDGYGDLWNLYWTKEDYEKGLPPFACE